MYCPYCGRETPPEKFNCTHCGEHIDGSFRKRFKTTTISAPPAVNRPATPPGQQKNPGKTVVKLFGFFALLIGLFTYFVVFVPQKQNETRRLNRDREVETDNTAAAATGPVFFETAVRRIPLKNGQGSAGYRIRVELKESLPESERLLLRTVVIRRAEQVVDPLLAAGVDITNRRSLADLLKRKLLTGNETPRQVQLIAKVSRISLTGLELPVKERESGTTVTPGVTPGRSNPDPIEPD